MEAFSFMKFWRPSGKARRDVKSSDSARCSSAVLVDSEVELGEGDDSFFELEISPCDFSHRDDMSPTPERERDDRAETTRFPVSPSTIDHFSKNKIIPVEVGPNKPHSPIALLKSGPKFKPFSFKKSKPFEAEKSTPAETRHEKRGCKSLNGRFIVEDDNENRFCCRKTASIANPQHPDDTVSEGVSSASSKRFFRLIRPFYAKPLMTKQSNKSSNATASPASSPAMVSGKDNRQRSNVPSIVRRHLGKSRSASAAVGGASPANRVDESFLVQQDGIQNAILHCKRSFHSSRESLLLSRSTSDSSSSREKLSTSSSEDSYVFSRISSDSLSEKSTDRQKISLP